MHRFVAAIFRWSSSRPRAALASALALTLAFATGFAFLRIDASIERLVSREDPEVRYLAEVRENFGERPVMLWLARSGNLASPALLERFREESEEIGAIEGVERISSLFNLRLPHGDGAGVRDVPALPEIPADAAEARRALDALLTSGIVAGQFLNRAGDALAFLIFLEPESAGGTNHRGAIETLERRRAALAESVGGEAEITLLGAPLVKILAERYILRDLLFLAPVALAVVGVLIFLFFRSLAAVFLPLLTGSLGAVATLGFMGWAGFEINAFLSTIVVLLLVVGCTEDLHILSDHLENLRGGMENLAAIRAAGDSLGRALVLTTSTTVLGFLSVAFTDFAGLRHFSISCAFGMAVNFLITLLVVPAALALLPPRLPSPDPAARPGPLARVAALLDASLRRRRGPALASLLLLFLGGVAASGLSRLEVNTAYLRFFRDDSEIVRAYRRFLDAFGGGAYLTVTVETGALNGFENPARLDRLRRFQASLEEECGHAFGLLDLLEEYSKASPTGSARAGGLPSAETLREFRKAAPREVLRPFLDYDGSRVAIRLRVHAPASLDALRIESRVHAIAQECLGDGFEVRVAGDVLLISRLCEQITARLLTSLLVLALAVAFMIAVSTRSPAIGLVAILPNLFPVVVTLGAMGWLGIPMSVATFPVTLVAFGVTVDDTIHLLARHHLERARGGGVLDAVSRGLARELRPVLATAVIVAAGYLVMTLSPFRVNAEVGLLFAIAMLSGVVADLVLTPLLLVRLDRGGARSS